eukprot:1148832-Pelagomonas_calceolata.AAC.2
MQRLLPGLLARRHPGAVAQSLQLPTLLPSPCHSEQEPSAPPFHHGHPDVPLNTPQQQGYLQV